MTAKSDNKRCSNIELLRIICITSIVLYHLIYFFIEPLSTNEIMWKAIQIPLHFGVPTFVIISGFFGIRNILPKLIHIVTITVFYGVVIVLISYFIQNGGGIFLPLSKSPYWFVRSYILLLILAPMLNRYIEDSNNLLFLMIGTGFMAFYIGAGNVDLSLAEGKNIVNFVFLYTIGVWLRKNLNFISKKNQNLFISFVVIQIMMTFVYASTNDITIREIIWKLFFPYNSPFNLMYSIAIFIAFRNLRLQSANINNLATCVFEVYIIHHHPYIHHHILEPLCERILNLQFYLGNYICIMYLLLISMLCFVICYIIHIGAFPLLNSFEKVILMRLNFLKIK